MGDAALQGDGVELLCYFLHRYLDFRVPEVSSLAELAGAGGQIAWRAPDGGDPDSPFWRLRVPHFGVAEEVMRRSVLARVMLHVWGEGDTLQEAVAAVVASHDASRDPFLAAGTTFSVKIDGFGMSHSMEEKVVMHQAMTPIPFSGRVDLKEPQHRFWVVEVGGPPTASLPSVRRRFYIGRQVGASERIEPLRALELRNRRYLGPTTMDHEMALIMCNMGHARRGALVFDPFVGTGSILLAAALRGALTMGTDIDLKVLREGKPDVHNGRKRSDDRVTVWSNFADAGLTPPLVLLRADLAAPPFRGPSALSGWAHALICDPPYGVRAGGRKSGGRKPLSQQKPIPDHLREGHIPSTGFYPLEECMADLLDTAAHSLVMRGRLVYFFPVALAEDSDQLLPRHPCLELVANCRQVLSTTFSRRLITMRKVREWYPAAKGEAHAEAQARAAAAPPAPPPDLDDQGGGVMGIRKHRGKRT